MTITPQNLVRHELIGLEVRVSKATDSMEGIEGVVVDESYSTLTIESDGKERKAIKENCLFVFKLPGKAKVEVDGKVIVGRPEDRIKKKQPKW